MRASLTLLLGLLAFCVISMDLALSIVYRRLAPHKRGTTLTVFTAAGLALLLFQMLDSWSALSFPEPVYQILGCIWLVLIALVASFMLMVVPVFACWAIGQPYRNPYRTIFILVAAAFLGVSLADIFVPGVVLDQIGLVLSLFDIFFCIIVMIRNRKGIDDRDVRVLVLTIFIVSLSLLPIVVVGIFSPLVRAIGVDIFLLAIAIVLLVFLFLSISRFIRLSGGQEKPEEEEKVDLSAYHITTRESEVIELVGQGLTNKEIAQRLNLSVNTVNNHIANIFSKTGVRSRIDLLNLIHKGIWS